MIGKGETGSGKGAADLATEAVRRELGDFAPRVAVVLGSGLGALAETVREARRVPYARIPGFPEPGVAGHTGQLVAGTLAGVAVLVQQGRFHLYEGHSAATAALPVRVFHRLGVTTLVVTNAAGGRRSRWRKGYTRGYWGRRMRHPQRSGCCSASAPMQWACPPCRR